MSTVPDLELPLTVAAQDAPRPSNDQTKRRLRFALGVLLAFAIIGAFYAYTHKDRYTDRLAELSRSIIGDENTAILESWYFAVQDRIDRTKYSIFGGDTNPFAEEPGEALVAVTAAPMWGFAVAATTPAPGATPSPTPIPTPPPLVLPQVQQVSASLETGEGVWTTQGLPHSSPEDVLMAKTFVRPDHERPYSSVGILLIDHRRVDLHITGGTDDPGGDLGVHGPGVIAEEHLPNLLVAWNGGFRGPHGGFGMYADGRQYRPLRDGYASVVLKQDGSVQIGQWGRDVFRSDDIVAVRQNAALLVENCEVSPHTDEGNDTWGYVKVDSSEFITWRSAIGLTKNGDILVAAGNSLSAPALARAVWAAGACWAMQLDINTPYVLTSVFHHNPDGSIEANRFMEGMQDYAGRFLGTQPNDFMYVTLDETNHVP
jgi:hypothetical protein